MSIVAKLGGATLTDAYAVRRTFAALSLDEVGIVVVSAPAGVTDALEAASQAQCRSEALQAIADRFATMAGILLSPSACGRFLAGLHRWIGEHSEQASVAEVVARGELWNALLISEWLGENGRRAQFVDARGGITWDGERAFVDPEFAISLQGPVIHIVTGFIARSARDGRTALLGRDGSDYTAALVAAATGAKRVDFVTSTRGIRSANPDVLGHDGERIEGLDYDQARLVAKLGGGVLHARTIGPLEANQIRARIFSPEAPGQATVISASSHATCGIGLFVSEQAVLLPLQADTAPPPGARIRRVSGHRCAYWDSLSPEKLLRRRHRELFETPKTVNVVLFGPGQIGSRVMSLLSQRDLELRLRHRLRVRVIGLVDSRGARLLDGTPVEGGARTLVTRLNAVGNGVIIDTTASVEVAGNHPIWIRQGLVVATANKHALAGDLDDAIQLLGSSRYACSTTVGAGQPMIQALRDAGPALQRFAATLSGSLNYILDRLHCGDSYASAINAATALGLVEPDPTADLSGADVARKAVILARAAGIRTNVADVQLTPLLEPGDTGGERLNERVEAVQRHGLRLVYVARLEHERLQVGLEELSPSDSLVQPGVVNSLRTNAGNGEAVVVGPGAGIDVTASNLLRDLFETLTTADSSRRQAA